MNKNNEIIIRGKTTYYSKDASIKKLEDLENKRIKLLGIDVLFIGDNYTQPSMENSVNYTDKNFPINIFTSSEAEIYEDARKFIFNKSQLGIPDIYFDIVTNEK